MCRQNWMSRTHTSFNGEIVVFPLQITINITTVYLKKKVFTWFIYWILLIYKNIINVKCNKKNIKSNSLKKTKTIWINKNIKLWKIQCEIPLKSNQWKKNTYVSFNLIL
jgi:hypothetical protein